MRRSRIRGRRFGVRFSMLCCWNSERFQSEDESRGSGTRLRNTRDTIVVFVCTGNQATPLLVCVACSDHTQDSCLLSFCVQALRGRSSMRCWIREQKHSMSGAETSLTSSWRMLTELVPSTHRSHSKHTSPTPCVWSHRRHSIRQQHDTGHGTCSQTLLSLPFRSKKGPGVGML